MCGVRDKSFKVDAFRRLLLFFNTFELRYNFSIDKAPIIEVPVLIIHGLKDEIISYEHSIVLARTLQKPVPVELLRNADHMSVLDTHSTPVYKATRRVQPLISFTSFRESSTFSFLMRQSTTLSIIETRS